MRNKVLRRDLAVLLVLALPSLLLGHGRNSTSLRGYVGQDSVRIEAHAVVLDVLQLAGVSEADWRRLAGPDKLAVLERGGSVFGERFRLVLDGDRIVEADAFRVELPDIEAGPWRSMEAGQQAVVLNWSYSLPDPPGELVFWELFEPDAASPPVLAQLMIRQEGELVMLPAELGRGFLVRYPFNWKERQVPLAERTSLGSAVCGWRNRPPNSVLEIGPDGLAWHVFIPVRQLVEAFGLLPAVLGSAGPQTMAGWFSIKVDGAERAVGNPGLKFHPLSAHSLAHGDSTAWTGDLNGMAELVLRVPLDGPPRSLEAAVALPGEDPPAVYTALVVPGRPVEFFIQSTGTPTLEWSPNH